MSSRERERERERDAEEMHERNGEDAEGDEQRRAWFERRGEEDHWHERIDIRNQSREEKKRKMDDEFYVSCVGRPM